MKKRILSLLLAFLIMVSTFNFSTVEVYSMDFDKFTENLLPKDDSGIRNDPDYLKLCSIIDDLGTASSSGIFLYKFIVDPKRAIEDKAMDIYESGVSKLEKRIIEGPKKERTERMYRSLNNIFVSAYTDGTVDQKDINEYLGVIRNSSDLTERLKEAAGYLFAVANHADKVLWPQIQKDIDDLLDFDSDSENNKDPEKPDKSEDKDRKMEVTGYDSEKLTKDTMKKIESNMDDEMLKSLGLDKIDRKKFIDDENLRKDTYNKLVELEKELYESKTQKDLKKIEKKFIELRDANTDKKEYVTHYDEQIPVPRLDEKVSKPADENNNDENIKPELLPKIETFGKLDNPGDFKITKKIEKIEDKLNEYKVSYKVENYSTKDNKDNSKVRISILLDCSMSMTNDYKLTKAKKYATDFIRNLFSMKNEDIYISVDSFAEKVLRESELVNFKDEEYLTNFVKYLSINSGTNFCQPLIKSAYKSDVKDTNFIVFLSDGDPSCRGVALNNPEKLIENHPEKFEFEPSGSFKYYKVNNKIRFEDFNQNKIGGYYLNNFVTIDEITGKKSYNYIRPSKINDIYYYYETLAISDYMKNELNSKIYTISLENKENANNFMKQIASKDCAYTIEQSDRLNEAFSGIETNIKQNIKKPIIEEKLNDFYKIDISSIDNSAGLLNLSLKDNSVSLKIEDLDKVDEENPNIRYGEFSYNVKLNDNNGLSEDRLKSNVPIYESSKIVSGEDTKETIYGFGEVPTKPTVLTFTTLYFDENNKPYLEKNVPVNIKSELGELNFRAYDGHTRYLNLGGNSYSFSNPIKNFKNTLVIKPIDGSEEIRVTGDLSDVKLPRDKDGNVKNAYIYYVSQRITPIFEGTNINDPQRDGYVRYIFNAGDQNKDKLKIYSTFRGTKLIDENLDFIGQDVFYYDVLKSIDFKNVPVPAAILNGKEDILNVKWDKEFPEVVEKGETFNLIYNGEDNQEEEKEKINIVFNAGSHGEFDKDAKTILKVNKNEFVDLSELAPKIIDNEGFVFKGWDKPLSGKFSEDQEFIAEYSLKENNGVNEEKRGSSERRYDDYNYKYSVTPVVTTTNSNKQTYDTSDYYIFYISLDYYKKIIDNEETTYKMDVVPYIKNDRTMLPLRYVSEAIGAEVRWEDSTRTAYFTKNGLTAKIQIDQNKIELSDGKVYVMDSKPDNINNRIFVSLTNVSKVFNLTNGNVEDGIKQNIEWDGNNRTVKICETLRYN